MNFRQFREKFQQNLDLLFIRHEKLFVVDTDKDELWNLYLDSFPKGKNKIFRERREYDCSCCRHFIKSFGNVVAIENNTIISIWNFNIEDEVFQPVITALNKFVMKHKVKDIFISKENFIGTHHNFEKETELRWDHFYTKIPKKFVFSANITFDTKLSFYRDARNVFKRALDEFSEDSIDTVLELISQKSLYRGEEWQAVLDQFLGLYKKYHKLNGEKAENFCWAESAKVSGVISKIRNHSIGVLLTDISEGMDLDKAVRRYEKIVAPTNYKRPKAIFTKKMIEEAEKNLCETGLLDSLGRRHATIEDINIKDIIFANKDAAKKVQGSVFDDLKKEVPLKTKSFNKVEEVSIETFVNEILPKTSNIELLFENKHEGNLFSLIAPTISDCKPLFKWDNGFSWAYNGNIADSMKERVKAAGGNVEGVLRFSLQWNEKGENQNDFDAHCKEPNGNHIWFDNKGRKHKSSGMLDVDIIEPGSKVAVENITWTDINKMQEGQYEFWVNNYNHCGGRTGFSAELEYDGQIYSFDYNNELAHKENILVAVINFNKERGIKFIKSLSHEAASKTVWGIQTNQFVPVSVMLLSPNYWNNQTGNKHYFFILKDCKNDNSPNGFFNEFLKEELMAQKKVFEALGRKMRVEPTDNQLSGLGFSSTKRNSVICKIDGSFSRTIKINF